MGSPVEATVDERGVWWRYGLALVAFVALGLATKSVVLNWIIGPLFPLLVLYVIPSFWRRVRDGAWPT